MRFERIGHYEVTAKIAEGGMGQLYPRTVFAHAADHECVVASIVQALRNYRE